jgi:outer membrane protein assembly factor BamB
VYLLGVDGGDLVARAFDLDGEPVWRSVLAPFEAQHGFAASPLVVDGTLIVANDNEGASSALFGLDPATGELRWKRERRSERASYSTPVVRTCGDGALEVLFASTAHGLTALEPATGALRWERDDLFEQRTVATPVVAGDLAFVFAGQGGGGQEAAAVELVGGTPEAPPGVRYRPRRALPYVPTPVFHGGLLFLWNDGGVVTCLDSASGDSLWQERVGGDFYASPLVVGDHLLAPSNAGELVVLRAGPEYELVQRLDLGEPTQATPAVADGVLYLRTHTHLIAVRGSEE